MSTRPHAARTDGRVMIHVAAGEAALLDVACDEEDLQRCRAFLRGTASPRDREVRMGRFGALEVLLARGGDDWSMRLFMRAAAADDADGGEQRASIQLARAELLKLLEEHQSPRLAAVPQPASPPPPASPLSARATPGARKGRRKRRRCELRSASDVLRLLLRLFLPLRTPHIVLLFEVFTALELQRRQTRITRVAEAAQYQYGGPVLAATVLLLGAAHIVRSMRYEWRVLQWLALATIGAWFAGRLLGAVWCRWRLQLAVAWLWWRVYRQERRFRTSHAGARLS